MEINDSPPYISCNIIGKRRGIGETLSPQSYNLIPFIPDILLFISVIMVRRYARLPNWRSFNRDKYSVETTAGVFTSSNTATNGLYQSAVAIIPSTTIQGMRKVKHITITVTDTATSGNLFWAIVYVPHGTQPNALFSLTGNVNTVGSMYEPNQFVMNCGVIDPQAGPIRFSSPLSRNLNSGDAIYLIVGRESQLNDPSLYFVARYAITLQ